MRKGYITVMGIVLTLVLVVSGVVMGTAVAQDGNTITQNELAQARQAGQSFVDMAASLMEDSQKWDGAIVESYITFNNLEGQPNAYLLSIRNEKGVAGYILVGGTKSNFAVIKVSDGNIPEIPTPVEFTALLQQAFPSKSKLTNIEKPIEYLCLGVDSLYAVYQIDKQELALNLINLEITRRESLTNKLPSLDSLAPDASGSELQAGKLSWVYESLAMSHYCSSGRCWCGPSSGVSIGRYYREVKGFSNLPSDNNMYDDLYDTMGCYDPWWVPGNGHLVWPSSYGPGFVEMAENYHPNDYWSYNHITHVDSSDYQNFVVSYIDNEWPLGLVCYGFNWEEEHWRAIRGYLYNEEDRYVICTDSREHADIQYLNWGALPNNFHDIVAIVGI
ncbi:MAG: hypothetical protein R6U37_08745 [Dehalococcoidia bacterium]